MNCKLFKHILDIIFYKYNKHIDKGYTMVKSIETIVEENGIKPLKKCNDAIRHVEFQDDLVKLFEERKELTLLKNQAIFGNETNAINMNIHLIENISGRTAINYVVVFNKLATTGFVSGKDIKYIQCNNYPYVRWNFSKSHEINYSSAFGFVVEKRKGYFFINSNKKLLTSFIVTDADREFNDKIQALIVKHGLEEEFRISKEFFDKRHLKNKEVQFKVDNDIPTPTKNEEEDEAYINITNVKEPITEMSLYGGSVNGLAGRVYNRDWNLLSTHTKTKLTKGSYAYDIDSSIFAFLEHEAKSSTFFIDCSNIELYRRKKKEIRLFVSKYLHVSLKESKQFINSIVYQEKLPKFLSNIPFLVDLHKEICTIIDKTDLHILKRNKYNKHVKESKYKSSSILFYNYEQWENKVINATIKLNSLEDKDYITNHDEIISYKKIDLSKSIYIDNRSIKLSTLFSEDDYSTRAIKAKEYHKVIFNKRFRSSAFKMASNRLIGFIKSAYGVRNRCKKIFSWNKWNNLANLLKEEIPKLELLDALELKRYDHKNVEDRLMKVAIQMS